MLAGQKTRNPGYGDINLQRKCSETLEDFSPRTKARNSRRVVHLPEGGGFSMNIGPYCHYATRNGVSAVFSGEIGSWPGIDVMKMSHDGTHPIQRQLPASKRSTVEPWWMNKGCY